MTPSMTNPDTTREALERVKAWLARGNPSGGMAVPGHDGTPSVVADIRTLVSVAFAPPISDEALRKGVAGAIDVAFSLGGEQWAREAAVGELLALFSDRLREVEGEEAPDIPGAFVGDIWFGDQAHRTRGTHRWTGSAWERLPSEEVVLMELLAKARSERDAAEARAQAAEAERDEARSQWSKVGKIADERSALAQELGKQVKAAEAALATAQGRIAEMEGARSGVYVASRASVLARGEMWRRHRAAGAPIISTWIDEDGENDTAELHELWTRIRREVVGSERLILYVEPDDFPLKGAFVEIGMALAAGVPITIVAPDVEIKDRNCRPFGSWIKHTSVSFAPTVEAALAHLQASGRDGGC